MMVGALDISKTATGWAFSDGKAWHSGVLKCPIKKPFDAGALHADYTGRVANWFDEAVWNLIGQHKPDVIAIEQPMPGSIEREKTVVDQQAQFAGQALRRIKVGNTNVDTTHFLHGLCVVATRICARRNIESAYIASQTWRPKLGIGHAPKHLSYSQKKSWYKARAREVCQLRSITISNSDQAEAVCIAIAYRAKLGLDDRDLFRTNMEMQRRSA